MGGVGGNTANPAQYSHIRVREGQECAGGGLESPI
jgi:hypothetical protein